MSRFKKSLVGKVGYCNNRDLGISNSGGHYVYIRKVNGNKCDVNVITSLETDNRLYDFSKLRHVKKGNIYPIPIYDADFNRWSGVTHNSIKNVDLSSVKNVGIRSIKSRHKFFIGKYMK